jgi:formamidopyrimidine-DNA glycosylase
VPELPEVETIRRDLDRELTGRTVATVVAPGGRSVRRHLDAGVLRERLVDRQVASVGRRGKYLLLRCGQGPANETVLVVHLGMSGQLLLAGAGDRAILHTHVVVGFKDDQGGGGGEQGGGGQGGDGHQERDQVHELRFVDPRTFGEVFVSSVAPGEETLPELAHLGLDALDEIKGPAQLRGMLQARRSQLKPLLMDQRFLAGIGNMYADEILFAARLRYDRTSDTLSRREVERLHQAMTDTLAAAISHRGSSLADQQYRDVFGAIGAFQRRHQVYAREGQPCPRCRNSIVRVKAAGRSNFLCLRCQH